LGAKDGVPAVKLSNQTSTALAALGLVGTAGSAHAALVTETYDLLPALNTTDEISVDSSSPQYYYQNYKDSLIFGTNNGGYIATTGKFGSATADPSLTYNTSTSVLIALFGSIYPSTGYINLEFVNGVGVTEYGYATINTTTGELETITYETSSSPTVPEPSTWALLITGAGMLGFASRRWRRRPTLAA